MPARTTTRSTSSTTPARLSHRDCCYDGRAGFQPRRNEPPTANFSPALNGSSATNRSTREKRECEQDAQTAGLKPRPSVGFGEKRPLVIYTIGHSTRTLDALAELLHAHGVRQLADVRTIPRSRHNPQFNAETAPEAFRKLGIRYRRFPSLGGLRHARPGSINAGWHNASFRGFADYMQTPEFAAGLEQLMKWASRPTAIMCAEAVPWRCHRSLIADALAARGAKVEHILGPKRTQTHTLTPFARVRGLTITYPAPLDLEAESSAVPPGIRRRGKIQL